MPTPANSSTGSSVTAISRKEPLTMPTSHRALGTVALLLLTLTFSRPTQAQNLYTITDLDVPGDAMSFALGINNHAQVFGAILAPNASDSRGVVWDGPHGVRPLPPLPG